MAVPRFRFAPSPTGFLHVGGARTALFNWLPARQMGGELRLRIEDTDVERGREEWVDGLMAALRWLGLEWDKEPVRQSQRTSLYADALSTLSGAGLTYWCDCAPDDVQRRATERGRPGSAGFCRARALGPGEGRALRFRTPDDGETSFVDLVRGEVTFRNDTLEDFVVQRSSGVPMFLLANAVDDVDMGITHVVRGEEHVNGTPKYLLLRSALGASQQPVFAHLPVIVNEKRQKLSKRRDDVALEGYRERGYLPEAMANYLATLGWGPPDGVEVRPIEEIVELFRLEDVTKSSAFFDVKKLDHFNGEYLRALPTATFVRRALPWLELDPPWPPERFDLARFEAMAEVVQERVTLLSDVPTMVDFVFLESPPVDEAAWEKVMTKGADLARPILDEAIAAYADAEHWTVDALHSLTASIAEAQGAKLGKAQAPIRVAVTGRTVGPPLFESLVVLGRDVTLDRLRSARARL